jgi:hypothetical protein
MEDEQRAAGVDASGTVHAVIDLGYWFSIRCRNPRVDLERTTEQVTCMACIAADVEP